MTLQYIYDTYIYMIHIHDIYIYDTCVIGHHVIAAFCAKIAANHRHYIVRCSASLSVWDVWA